MSEGNAKLIAKNTLFLYIRMFFTMLVGLFTSRIVLRTLGFEDYGIYNVVASVIVFFSFLQHALRNATSRYITFGLGSKDTKNLLVVYSMSINSHVILAIILLIILEIGGLWFVNHKLVIPPERLYAANWVYQFSIINFCISIIKTPWESNIVAHEKFNFYALISILSVVLNLVAVCVLVYSPIDKLITYAFFILLNTFLTFLCYTIFCRKNFKDCYFRLLWDSKLLKEFVSYSGWSLIVNLACGVSSQCISIFFNLFLGVIANAALGVSHQVVSHLNAFVSNFTQAFNPQIIKSYASKQDEYFKRLLFTTSKISYLLMFLVSIPVCINIKFILKVWLGDYPDLAPAFIIVTISYYLIEAIQTPFVYAVHATGNLKVHQIVVSVIRILAVPGMYIALKLGAEGVMAIGIWVISNFIAGVFRTIYMRTLINLPLGKYVKAVLIRLFIITVVSLPLPIILSVSINNSVIAFFSSSLVAVLTIAILSLYIAFDNQERAFVLGLPIIRNIARRFNLS